MYELKKYNPELLDKNYAVALSKADLLDEELQVAYQQELEKYFPNTPYEPFWTGEKNEWSKDFFWSVNFFTGHTFGRFPGHIPNFVRLVSER